MFIVVDERGGGGLVGEITWVFFRIGFPPTASTRR